MPRRDAAIQYIIWREEINHHTTPGVVAWYEPQKENLSTASRLNSMSHSISYAQIVLQKNENQSRI